MFPNSFIQGSGIRYKAAELFGRVSVAISSSFPVLSTSLEENYSKLSNSFQVSAEREPMSNPQQISASSSRFPDNMHFSSVSPHGRYSQNSPFISQSLRDEARLRSTHFSPSEGQPTPLINHPEENKDNSWCIDPLQDFLDFPENDPGQTGLLESNTGDIASDDRAKRIEWWADQLISVEDGPEPNWSEVLADVNVTDAREKVCSSIEHKVCFMLSMATACELAFFECETRELSYQLSPGI